MKFLEQNIDTIFIMLGSGCNFKCRYCMQSAESACVKPLPTEINKDIYPFIEQILDRQEGSLGLHFFGGEPMLYWDSLKAITERFADNDRVFFSTITNGSLITQERADFLNDYDFSVCVSWDGEASAYTRGKDVFADSRQKDILFSLKRLGVSGVLTSKTSPMKLMDDFQTLDNEYRAVHDYHLNLNMDELFDTGIPDTSLLNADYGKIREDMAAMASSYFRNAVDPTTDDIFNGALYCRHQLVNDIVNRVRNFVKPAEDGKTRYHRKHFAVCGNGLNTLNMDLAGNLYPCHNVFEPVGDIYSNYYKYLDKLLETDRTYDHYRAACAECSVYPACRGGCKLIGEEVRKESYCLMKKAVFEPVLEKLIDFGKEDHGC